MSVKSLQIRRKSFVFSFLLRTFMSLAKLYWLSHSVCRRRAFTTQRANPGGRIRRCYASPKTTEATKSSYISATKPSTNSRAVLISKRYLQPRFRALAWISVPKTVIILNPYPLFRPGWPVSLHHDIVRCTEYTACSLSRPN